MDTREAQSRSPWSAAFSSARPLASNAQARDTAFASPLRFATWLAQTGEKAGKQRKKMGKRQPPVPGRQDCHDPLTLFSPQISARAIVAFSHVVIRGH